MNILNGLPINLGEIFTINNIFSDLNIIQILLFFVCMLFAVLFGFFFGGCIFYKKGFNHRAKLKSRKKGESKEDAKAFYKEETTALEDTASRATTPLSIDFDDPDFDLNELLLEEEKEVNIELLEVADSSSGSSEKGKSDLKARVFGDPQYSELIRRRKNAVPVLGRRFVLTTIANLPEVSKEVKISVQERTPLHLYDRISIGGYTFAVAFVNQRVVKIFLRLHEDTAVKLKEKVNSLLKNAPSFGKDWYQWTLGEGEKFDALITQIISLSYKYVVRCEFTKNESGILVPSGESYEAVIDEECERYIPFDDEEYCRIADALNAKYPLGYFGISEACSFTNSLKKTDTPPSEMPVALDYLANRLCLLKSGDNIFAMVFEKYGVTKMILRLSEERFRSLCRNHPRVNESDFPEARDWYWYSVIIDSTFNKEDVENLIKESYEYVTAFHKEGDSF